MICRIATSTTYVDRDRILRRIAGLRRICATNNWPVIDVTRRSVEETAATIIKLLNERRAEQRVALQAAVGVAASEASGKTGADA